MPKLDLLRAQRIKAVGGELLALKGPGFVWHKFALLLNGFELVGFPGTFATDIALTQNSVLGFRNTPPNPDAYNLSGVISGPFALTINGSPDPNYFALVLSGDNTYTGGSTINGRVQVGAGAATGSLGAGPIVNSGTLAFNRPGFLLDTPISGDGNVIIDTGNNTFSYEFLLVAGGGAGGTDGGANVASGGGGAGGMLMGTLRFITQQLSIGQGGIATTSSSTNGGDSTWGQLTAVGGGRGNFGGGHEAGPGHPGGSGGGVVGTFPAGQGIPGQGNNGGNGAGTIGSIGIGGAGGGGAGGVGTDGSAVLGGNMIRAPGGAGRASSISGAAVTYARGGNGGASAGNLAGASAPANTGNGGNGSDGNNRNGGSGGSGIFIIAYSSTNTDLIIGGGLTFVLDTASRPGFKVYTFTQGSGTVTVPDAISVISAPSTYTGGTTINSGSVLIESTNAFGSGTVTLNPGTTLYLNGLSIPNTVINLGGNVVP